MADMQFYNDQLEFVDEYYGMNDFDDDMFTFSQSSTPKSTSSNNNDNDSDEDDSFDSDFDLHDFHIQGKSRSETTAGEARKGKDIQGIPWERLNFTRDDYRETRLKQYKNYESLPTPDHHDNHLLKECKSVKKGHNFYDFQFNTRVVKSTIVHFQDGVVSEQLAHKGSLSMW